MEMSHLSTTEIVEIKSLDWRQLTNTKIANEVDLSTTYSVEVESLICT